MIGSPAHHIWSIIWYSVPRIHCMKYRDNTDTSANIPTTITDEVNRILKKTNPFATTNCSDIKMMPDQLLYVGDRNRKVEKWLLSQCHNRLNPMNAPPVNLSADSDSNQWASPDQMSRLNERQSAGSVCVTPPQARHHFHHYPLDLELVSITNINTHITISQAMTYFRFSTTNTSPTIIMIFRNSIK